jgi:predicted metal-binding protein
MEAMGIDIQKTAEKVGFSMALSSEENIKFTGLILID